MTDAPCCPYGHMDPSATVRIHDDQGRLVWIGTAEVACDEFHIWKPIVERMADDLRRALAPTEEDRDV